MRPHGRTTRRIPTMSALRVVAFAAVVVAAAGCAASPAPARTPADRVLAETVRAAGLVDPIHVLDVRLGVLWDLKGVTPDARAALAAWQGTARTALDEQAWKV